jgi:hypothetical protein
MQHAGAAAAWHHAASAGDRHTRVSRERDAAAFSGSRMKAAAATTALVALLALTLYPCCLASSGSLPHIIHIMGDDVG